MPRSAEEAKQEVCPLCGQPLVEIRWGEPDWGQRKFILACGNYRCVRYRNPVRTITKGAEE